MLAVGELEMFVGMVLLNLYENEAEGLGLGPHRHSGAIVATAPPWERAGPLQMAQCQNQNQACLPPSQTPAYIMQGGTSSLIL
jgi:hypothetical protein